MAMQRPPGLLGTPAERQRKRLRDGLLSGPAPVTPPAPAPVDWPYGGDRGGGRDGSATDAARAGGRDVKDWGSIGEWARDPQVKADTLALMDMLSVGPARGLGIAMGYDPLGDSARAAAQAANLSGVPGLGIQDGQMSMMSPELQGRNDPSQMGGYSGASPGIAEMNAATAAAAEADMDPNGFMFRGGKIRRGLLDMDPPGPDDTVIAAKTGERVLNEAQWSALKPETRKEIEAVFKKTGARK